MTVPELFTAGDFGRIHRFHKPLSHSLAHPLSNHGAATRVLQYTDTDAVLARLPCAAKYHRTESRDIIETKVLLRATLLASAGIPHLCAPLWI